MLKRETESLANFFRRCTFPEGTSRRLKALLAEKSIKRAAPKSEKIKLYGDGRDLKARGEVIVVKFADDFVVGSEHREDGEQFWSELVERLKRFGLELHAQKTRLIEFGRQAEEDRQSPRRRKTGDLLTFWASLTVPPRRARDGLWC
ncbi:MAG TPA: reverse transcriptase domain-containing protein [Candidatus Binatia bacterium]|nr:reverse transcriptase domain-containing protein [Candidatus Binatia bacterium]